MSKINKIKVENTTYDIQDNTSGFITKDVNNLTNYELKTATGNSIEMSIDSSTYVMTLSLKNSQGTILNTQTVDLPLETMVVGGTYDSTNKKIVLTLKNGNTIDVPVGDLINGLQSEITSTNKLDASLVDDSLSNNKFVTTSEKTTWNNKSDFSGDYNDLSNKPTIPDVSTKEDTANKVTTIDSTSTDEQYASAKAIYDLVSGASGGNDINFGIIYNAGQQNNTNTFIIENLKKGLYFFKDTESVYSSLIYRWSSNSYFNTISTEIKNSVRLFLIIEKSLEEIPNTSTKIGYIIAARNGSGGYADSEGRYQFFELRVNKSTSTISVTYTDSESPKVYFVTDNMQYWYGLKYFATIPQQSNTTAPTLDSQFTNKKYVDDKPTTYTGYDSSKTQVLKNVNGTLTWVDE